MGLFTPTYDEIATNRHLGFSSLFGNHKPTNSRIDKMARHWIRYGEMPSKSNESEHHDSTEEKIEEGGNSMLYRNRSRFARNYSAYSESGDDCGCEQSSLCMGVGLGKAHSTGNRLFDIGINQYQDSDASFVGDGEDPNTSKINIPAIIAARMAGGNPDPQTLHNGINKRSLVAPFKLRPLRDDLGPNG